MIIADYCRRSAKGVLFIYLRCFNHFPALSSKCSRQKAFMTRNSWRNRPIWTTIRRSRRENDSHRNSMAVQSILSEIVRKQNQRTNTLENTVETIIEYKYNMDWLISILILIIWSNKTVHWNCIWVACSVDAFFLSSISHSLVWLLSCSSPEYWYSAYTIWRNEML